MGKKRKKMGLGQMTIITAVNMMGSGIILLPGNLDQGRRDPVLAGHHRRRDVPGLRVRALAILATLAVAIAVPHAKLSLVSGLMPG